MEQSSSTDRRPQHASTVGGFSTDPGFSAGRPCWRRGQALKACWQRGMAVSHRTRSSTGATRQRSSMDETEPGVPVHQLPQELLREIFALLPFHERCVKGSLPADSATPPMAGVQAVQVAVQPFRAATSHRSQGACARSGNARTQDNSVVQDGINLHSRVHSRCCERAWLPMHGIYATCCTSVSHPAGWGSHPAICRNTHTWRSRGLLRQPAVVSRNPRLKSLGSCKPSCARHLALKCCSMCSLVPIVLRECVWPLTAAAVAAHSCSAADPSCDHAARSPCLPDPFR